MQRIIHIFITAIFMLSSSVYADEGLFFNVISSGTPATIEIILCLDGKGPVSCQNYLVAAQNLSITTVTNHHYPAAGIKVLTPGYTATGCTSYAKTGYCLFETNNTESVQINLEPLLKQESSAYITPTFSSQTIDKFTVDSNTGLLASNPTIAYSSSTQQYQNLTFEVVNGMEYAYVLDPSNSAVYWCTINPNGSFNNCLPTTSLANFGQPRDIAFATFNAQYAYIVDPDNIFVYQCALDTTGGGFSSCTTYDSLPLAAPYGIAFATDGNGDQQAYITDAGIGGAGNYGDMLLCSMQSDGSFNACNQTPSSGAPNWIPYAIAFTSVNGTQYAYVADNGTGTPGHVYRCTLNNDGTFVNSGCTQTPVNDSSLSDWYPYDIVFQTVNEKQYAYIINSSGSIGNIYRCLLDDNGILTDCEMTPGVTPTAWIPLGIAFR